jgi:predicted anti-sigma-YlaC factor YlaD
MTVTGAGSPTCRELRQLLGVYVVGAIDPAERAQLDEHLSTCAACRDELAGLAGLPAMLSRVPEEDVARLGRTVISLPEHHEPSPELLDSLLRRVAARRRTRMWRGAAAVAAAALVAAGGTAAGLVASGSPAGTTWNAASGMNPATHVSALVHYAKTSTGTQMQVRVRGIATGTNCQFFVVTRNGKAWAASWTVGPVGYNQNPWYPAAAKVSPSSVRDFQITAAGKLLVTIPAA